MSDHFDPNEPRGEHGRWVKLAQGLKRLSQEDQATVVKAMGELPKGGHGNRTSIKGVEIRRHQNGGVQVKIGGEARHYSSHEAASRAVIARRHNEGGTSKTSPVHTVSAGKDTPTRANQTDPASSNVPASPSGLSMSVGASGNTRVELHGKRIGIITGSSGKYFYEHKRGDSHGPYDNLTQAAEALLKRDSAGESVGGRGETMRQYAGIGSAADERTKQRREQLFRDMAGKSSASKIDSTLPQGSSGAAVQDETKALKDQVDKASLAVQRAIASNSVQRAATGKRSSENIAELVRARDEAARKYLDHLAAKQESARQRLADFRARKSGGS